MKLSLYKSSNSKADLHINRQGNIYWPLHIWTCSHLIKIQILGACQRNNAAYYVFSSSLLTPFSVCLHFIFPSYTVLTSPRQG